MDEPVIPPVPVPEPPKATNSDDALSRTLLIIGLLLVAGAVGVYLYSPDFRPAPSSSRAASDQSAGPVIPLPVPSIRGTPAAAFELPDLNGRMVRLADFKGKILLINFWATWCNPCLTEIPWFLEFKERYGPQGFEVVAVNIFDEDKDGIKPFVEKNNMLPLNVVLGNDDTAELFGGFPGLPVTFMVDREGKYFSKHLGLVSKEDVEDDILMMLHASPAEEQPAAPPAPQG